MNATTVKLRRLLAHVRRSETDDACELADEFLSDLDRGAEGPDLSTLNTTEQRIVARLAAGMILGGIDPQTGR